MHDNFWVAMLLQWALVYIWAVDFHSELTDEYRWLCILVIVSVTVLSNKQFLAAKNGVNDSLWCLCEFLPRYKN